MSRSTRVAQDVWLMIAAWVTAIWAISVASQWATILTVCHADSTCANFQRTPTAFGASLRDQVDISQLSMELTAVVRDALHPGHVALWLREANS